MLNGIISKFLSSHEQNNTEKNSIKQENLKLMVHGDEKDGIISKFMSSHSTTFIDLHVQTEQHREEQEKTIGIKICIYCYLCKSLMLFYKIISCVIFYSIIFFVLNKIIFI